MSVIPGGHLFQSENEGVLLVANKILCPAISGIMGIKVPAYRYGLQPGFAFRPGSSPSPKVFKEEVKGLSQKVDSVLARIENLKTRRGHEYRYSN